MVDLDLVMRCSIVLGLGCSTAAKRDPVPRGSDSIAGDAAPGDATEVDAPAVATFPWQRRRDAYEDFLRTPVGSQPCDPRTGRLEPSCPPPDVRERAARLLGAPQAGKARVDRGALDGVKVGWRAALVDAQERVITEWAPVRAVDKHTAQIAVPESWLRFADHDHVALVESGGTP